MKEDDTMPIPNWEVTNVIPNNDYTLTLTFASGEIKRFDMKPYIERRPWRSLANKNLFSKPFLSCGSVAWNDDIDMAPEVLYEESIPVGDTNDQRMCANH